MTIAEHVRLIAVTPDHERLRGDALAERCALLVQHGATAVMFREKSLDADSFLVEARRCGDAVRAAGGWFIVNERVDAAIAVGADALHLTFRSVPEDTGRAREAGLVLGRSIHDPTEARAAAEEYLIFGPVRPTPSKTGLVEPRGWAALAEAAATAPCPVAAIGGLGPGDAARARRADAAGIAVIRALFDADEPAATARRLRDEADSALATGEGG